MINIRSTLIQTAANSVGSLEYQYLRLNAMCPSERDAYRQELRDNLARLEGEFSGVGAHNSKLAMLTFALAACYSRVFGFNVPVSGKPDLGFDSDRIHTLMRDREAFLEMRELFWRDGHSGYCSEELFERIASLGVEEQATLLCDWVTNSDYLQIESETVGAWLVRIGCDSASWSTYFNRNLTEEKNRWFPSQKRLSSIANEMYLTLREVHVFSERLSSYAVELKQALGYLRSLRDRISAESAMLYEVDKVVKAIRAGKTLEHVKLEEMIEHANVWGKVLRGM